ncbi:MAG: hypothetical protein RIC19_12100 [Phaeodactylibacter sp.]|uniref:hypothetical protein n=1 Tax=Phaeodactylibacter sp. TaxID=1940289 RepID=UPI0032ED98AF
MRTQVKLLSTANIEQAAMAVATQLVCLQAPCNAIVAQSDIKIDSLPALPKQQSTARSISKSLLDQVGDIFGNMRDTVVMFENEYSSLYGKLIAFTKAYETDASKKQARELTEGIILLEKTIEADLQKRQLVFGNIQSLVNAASSFSESFYSTVKEVEKDLGPAVTGALQSQINSVFEKINQDNKTLSKGVTEDIKPIFDMIVAAISSAASKGEQQQEQVQRNSEIMSASIKKIKDVDAKQKAAMADVDAQIKRYKELVLQQESDKLDYVLVCSLNAQFTILNTQLPVLKDFWANFDAGWKDLLNGLKTLAEHLSSNKPDNELIDQLQQAKGDWNELSIKIKGLYSIGKLPVQYTQA